MTIRASGRNGNGRTSPARTGAPQHSAERDDSELVLHVTDGLPAEHSSSVAQHDALHRGVHVRVDPELAADQERLPRVGQQELRDYQVRDLVLYLLVERCEQTLLAPEVVVERPFGNPGPSDDFVEGSVGEASCPEQPSGCIEQIGPRCRPTGRPAVGCSKDTPIRAS